MGILYILWSNYHRFSIQSVQFWYWEIGKKDQQIWFNNINHLYEFTSIRSLLSWWYVYSSTSFRLGCHEIFIAFRIPMSLMAYVLCAKQSNNRFLTWISVLNKNNENILNISCNVKFKIYKLHNYCQFSSICIWCYNVIVMIKANKKLYFLMWRHMNVDFQHVHKYQFLLDVK